MWGKQAFVIITTAAGVAAIGLSHSPVFATSGWTVTPGGAATASESGWAQFTDTTDGTPMPECKSSSLAVTLQKGSGLAGADIGSITKPAFNNCKGPPAALPNLTFTYGGLPWHLNALSYDSSTGVVNGTITGIKIDVAGDGCKFVIDGTASGADGRVDVTYTNATGELAILPSGGNLHFYHVSDCYGLIKDGDSATISNEENQPLDYAVSPGQAITQ